MLVRLPAGSGLRRSAGRSLFALSPSPPGVLSQKFAVTVPRSLAGWCSRERSDHSDSCGVEFSVAVEFSTQAPQMWSTVAESQQQLGAHADAGVPSSARRWGWVLARTPIAGPALVL